LCYKSLETLAIRLDRHCENALKVAEFGTASKCEPSKIPVLKSHPQYEIAKKQMKLGGSIVALK
jgi:O-succinylhomoserine sulfhydrylase